jgi:hypothetical protein
MHSGPFALRRLAVMLAALAARGPATPAGYKPIREGRAAVMTRTATARPPAACPARDWPRPARDIEDAMCGSVPADEPAVTLSSLARSVPSAFQRCRCAGREAGD